MFGKAVLIYRTCICWTWVYLVESNKNYLLCVQAATRQRSGTPHGAPLPWSTSWPLRAVLRPRAGETLQSYWLHVLLSWLKYFVLQRDFGCLCLVYLYVQVKRDCCKAYPVQAQWIGTSAVQAGHTLGDEAIDFNGKVPIQGDKHVLQDIRWERCSSLCWGDWNYHQESKCFGRYYLTWG